MLQNLFVYGTLAPGQPNEHVLTEIGGTWKPAMIRGILHEKGWGAEMGCPGITLDENGHEVQGFIFSSTNLVDHWKKLDAFEGEEYTRTLATVTLKDKSTTDAYIYTLKRE